MIHGAKTSAGRAEFRCKRRYIQFDQNRIEKAASQSGRWSLYAAETVGSGNNAFGAELGWPDVTLGFVHGMGDSSDIGVKFELTYGFEGSTVDNQIGFGVRVPFRFNLSKGEKVSVLFHVDPGIKALTYDPISFGVQAPVGLAVGFHPMPNLSLAFGVDIPVVVYFTGIPKPIVFIPPQFGPTIEYHVEQNFVFGLNARFGPSFFFWSDTETDLGTVPGGNDSDFAFRVQLVLGYRM